MKLENTLSKLSILLFVLIYNTNANAESLSDYNQICTLSNNKGDFVTAAKAAEGILKIDAKNRDGLLCKGKALGGQGKYTEALAVLEQSAATAPTDFDALISYILIGNLHKDNQKNAEAIASYEKSLKLCATEKNKKFTRINHNLIAEAHIQNNNLNAALASYLAGHQLAANDDERTDSNQRLASTYKALGQYDLAIEYQVKAILTVQRSGTLDQYADASLELGNIYELAKDYPSAEKTYSKLAQFGKDNGGIYFEAKANMALARLKEQAGDVNTAKILLASAQKLAQSSQDNELLAEINASIKKLGN